MQTPNLSVSLLPKVCLAAAAAGTGLSWTSPVLDELKSPNSTIAITKEQGSWIASNLAIGAIIGAVPSGILADKIGRRSAAISICVPYIVSWLMVIFAQSVQWLYYARILIGKFSPNEILKITLFISSTTYMDSYRNRNRRLVCCRTTIHQ